MKTYSFKLNNTKKSNNTKKYTTYFNSFSKALDDTILSNVIANNPWMKDLLKKDDHITISTTKNTTYDFKEFLEAMNYLAGLDAKDTYDYELADGTPVKLFADEIQIGFDLIPLTPGYTYRMFENLKPKTKKTIIDIYISIKK